MLIYQYYKKGEKNLPSYRIHTHKITSRSFSIPHCYCGEEKKFEEKVSTLLRYVLMKMKKNNPHLTSLGV
jgi:hypothetical protein